MNSSKRKVSRTVAAGLFLQVLANLTRWGLHPTGHISANTLHGIVGLLYGVSIGLLLVGVRRHARQGESGTCA